jgi:hypothetical protein
MRVAGKDLQHNRQTRTADELHVPVRQVRQTAGQGGPIIEQTKLAHEIQREKLRHESAMNTYEG